MRRLFVPMDTAEDARIHAPWAIKLVKVSGGYLAFESLGDWVIWCRYGYDTKPIRGYRLDTYV